VSGTSQALGREVLRLLVGTTHRDDPYPVYRRLLAEDPVHKTPFGMLVLSRYRDCAAILRDPRCSSDASHSNMYKAFMGGRDPEEVFGALAGMRPPPPSSSQSSQLFA